MRERDQQQQSPPDEDDPVTVELDPREFVTCSEGRCVWVREGRRALDAQRERERRPIAKDRAERLFEACRRLEQELDVEHASHAAYDAWRARGIAADGSRRMAPGMVKAHEPVLVPTGLMNLTDHDSRPMRTHGFKPLQGYNAQLAVNDQQVVIAAELTCDSPDFGHLEPMVRAAQRELRSVDLGDPSVVVADAGYWHQRQIETIVSDGMQVLVPPDSSLRRGTRSAWTGGLHDFMRRVLATPHGSALYRQRQATIEPVFGQLKFNRDFRRFQRRGRAACRSEWRLTAATTTSSSCTATGSRPRWPEAAAPSPRAQKATRSRAPSTRTFPTASGNRSSATTCRLSRERSLAPVRFPQAGNAAAVGLPASPRAEVRRRQAAAQAGSSVRCR